MKPWNVMIVPDAENSTAWWLALVAPMRTVEVVPVASAIWEATVRFQIISYRRNSSPRSSDRTLVGVRKVSPDGRLASWISVDVMNGAAGRRVYGLESTPTTEKAASDSPAASAPAAPAVRCVT